MSNISIKQKSAELKATALASDCPRANTPPALDNFVVLGKILGSLCLAYLRGEQWV